MSGYLVPDRPAGAVTAPVLLDVSTSLTSSTTQSSGTFSPAANALLLFVVSGGRGTDINFIVTSITDTFMGTGSWTWVQVQQFATNDWMLAIGWAQLGPTPGTGSITATFSGANPRYIGHAFTVTGHNVALPNRQTFLGASTASGVISFNMPLVPLETSVIIAGVASRDDTSGIIPGSLYNEIADTGPIGASNSQTMQTQYKRANTSRLVDWSGLGITNNVARAIEIQAA